MDERPQLEVFSGSHLCGLEEDSSDRMLGTAPHGTVARLVDQDSQGRRHTWRREADRNRLRRSVGRLCSYREQGLRGLRLRGEKAPKV